MPDTSGPPDKANIQGLILRGYSHPFSCHMLFKFPDQAETGKAAAAKFVSKLLPYLQGAQDWGTNKPKQMLNIGLTYNGIITVKPSLANGRFFSPSFTEGPASADPNGPQASLFDLGPSAPENWWYKKFATGDIHAAVHVYALTSADLTWLVTVVADAANAAGVIELFPLNSGIGRLEQYELADEKIYFGYRDGIDNPDLRWPSDPSNPTPQDLCNFLIGYPPINAGPTQGDAGIFAKDGCYNAFRIFYQDVAMFENFLDANTAAVAAATNKSPQAARDWLAAKLVGRWYNGSPLVLSPDAPDPNTAGATEFGYSGDTLGQQCPFSAHTRNANPRDEGIIPPSSLPPRIERRGMPYGAPPNPPDYTGDRGLIGLFLVGDLAGQFELVYSWMNQNTFSLVFSTATQDAVLANRETPGADTSFTIPTQGNQIVIPALPQFLVTRGTAYFLLPSVTTLRSIAAGTA
jgi:deferrochelatase/peroxidase EfeB